LVSAGMREASHEDVWFSKGATLGICRMIVTSMRQHAIRRRQLLIAVGGAIVVALALIVASHLSAASEPASAPTSSSGQAEVAGVAEVRQRLEGIPQSGTVIGKPDAPVRLVEYADL